MPAYAAATCPSTGRRELASLSGQGMKVTNCVTETNLENSPSLAEAFECFDDPSFENEDGHFCPTDPF